MKRKFVLALDIGGTSLKSAIITSEGTMIKNSLTKVPIDSQGPRQDIIDALLGILKRQFNYASKLGLDISGLGIASPGPADYSRGIFLMKQKFASLYGANLKDIIREGLNLSKKFPIIFEVDSWAFLRGEAWVGAAKGYKRVVGLTLGTGLGAAFMVDEQIVIEGPGVPPLGWVAILPFRGGVVEDFISRKWILSRYSELVKRKEPLDVKDIAILANRGQNEAIQVFRELGENLAEILKPILTDFRAECLILGGQISKSISLFKDPLKERLRHVASLKKISRARLIMTAALFGVSRMLFENIKSPAWEIRPEEVLPKLGLKL